MFTRPAVGITLATAVALAVRLAAVAILAGFDTPPREDANPDQLDYELFAAEMAAGRGYRLDDGLPTACRPPGTSFTLLPVYAVAGRSWAAGRAWWCVLGAATVAVSGFAAARAFDPTAGVAAAWVLALYPGHWYYSVHFLSEVPFGLFLAGGTLCGLLAVDRGPRWAVPCGLLLGLTALTRPNMALGVGLLAAVWLAAGRRRAAGLLVLAAAAAVGPWVVRNSIVVGKPAICTVIGGLTYWGAHNPRVGSDTSLAGFWVPCSGLVDADHPFDGPEMEQEVKAWGYGTRWAADNLDRMPVLTLHKLGRIVLPYSETPNRLADLGLRCGWLLAGPLAAAGAVLGWRRNRPAAVLFLVPFAVTLLTAAVFYGCGRFRDGIMPALVPFAGLAVARLVERLRPGSASASG